MNQRAPPTIAVLLIGYGALSGRPQSTVVAQAMVFVALGLLVGNRVLDLVDVDTANQATILAPTDAADTSTSHLGFRCIIRA
jgi:hypothetical protein